MSNKTISINRASVLGLWSTVSAERLGYKENEALLLGKALMGLTVQAKGRRLGIITPIEHKARESKKKLPGSRILARGRAVSADYRRLLAPGLPVPTDPYCSLDG